MEWVAKKNTTLSQYTLFLWYDGKLESGILVGQLFVDSRERVKFVLQLSCRIWVQKHLKCLAAILTHLGALAKDLWRATISTMR